MTAEAKRGFLAGGEMGALIRAHDWAATPLGPPEAWSQSLRTTVQLALTTRHPVFIFWGPELTCLYNDAYSATIGPERHPWALGRPGREVWDEIWHIIGPQIDLVMSGRGATWHEDHLVPITRHGRRENVWWTYSYSPILDDNAPGGIGGVLVLCHDVTEQHLARETLRESEERFRIAADSSPALMWMTDDRGEVIFANAQYEAFFGVEAEEMLGSGWRTIIHPDDVDAFHDAFRAAFAAREPFHGTARVVHPVLGIRWLSSNGKPRYGAGGRFLGYTGVNVDITDATLAEAALRESEAEFRAAFEASPIPMHQTDCATGRLLQVNPAFCRLVGRPAEDLLGHPVSETTHPDDREANLAAFRRMARRELPAYEAEKRYIRPDGTIKWARFSSALIRDASGRPLRTVAVAQDITERKEAVAALRESEARWRGLFESMHEAFSLCELVRDVAGCPVDYRRIEVNPAFERHLGIPAKVALARTAREIWPNLDPHWIKTFAHVVETGEPVQYVRHVAAIDRWFEGHAYRTGPERFAVLFFDVTERRVAEERQALLAREVDHRAKNALAVVLAALRLTTAKDVPTYMRAIEGRVAALARAQTLLAEDRWAGADLRALLRGELEPFLGGQRADLDGPPVALPAGATQPLAMAVHELATNAVKHGALSVPRGRVSVSWRLDRKASVLQLRWAEMGGPAVIEPPARRGFGSRVLDATVRHQLGGAVSLAWEATGLVCQMEVPLGRVPDAVGAQRAERAALGSHVAPEVEPSVS